jgi:hypothetical protein
LLSVLRFVVLYILSQSSLVGGFFAPLGCLVSIFCALSSVLLRSVPLSRLLLSRSWGGLSPSPVSVCFCMRFGSVYSLELLPRVFLPLSDRVRLWGLRVSPSKTFLFLYIQKRCLLFRSEYFRMWTLLYITSEKRKLWKYLREPPSFL